MSKIEIKKTEPVWWGKYDYKGKLVPVENPGPCPFQVLESINESRVKKGNIVHKEHSIIEEKAYRDTLGNGIVSFQRMLNKRLQIINNLLSNQGSLNDTIHANRFKNSCLWIS